MHWMYVIWHGPVNAAQSGQRDASYVTCTGDGKPSCAQMAESDGRDLGKLAARLRIPDGEPLILRAFSAGGHAWKRYLDNDSSRARVAAVTLADAVFETSEIAAPGFVKFGVEAATGGKLFVATGSTGANSTGTGAHYVGVLQAAIEQATGRKFEPVDVPGLGRGMRLGGNYFFDLGSQYSHGEHATKVAPIVWSALVEPFIGGARELAKPLASRRPSRVPALLLAAAGLGLLTIAVMNAKAASQSRVA